MPSLPFLSESAQLIELPDGQLIYYPDAFSAHSADQFFEYCQHSLPWRQDYLNIAGKRIALPRLQNWFGEPEAHYSYSRLSLKPLPWTKELLQIKARVEELSNETFNAVLANLYRNGADSVGWHSDDEKELGEEPVIASVSFGAVRNFQLRHKSREPTRKWQLPLQHGSVLLMKGSTQKHWRHQLPKDPAVNEARVNLTFRKIIFADADYIV